MNSVTLLAALQAYLQKQSIELDALGPAAIVKVMVAWFSEVLIADTSLSADALVYRYGGWSEGCATGFKLSLMRRVTERNVEGGETEWFAGITMMFEPSRFSSLAPYSTATSEWKTVQAFQTAVESSPAYRAAGTTAPMGVMVESGGLR